MLSRIVSLFAPSPGNAELAQSALNERLQVATCVVMLEVAGADNEFSPAECELIIGALRRRFDLSQADAEELIAAADSQRADSTGLWKFTNQINQCCSNDEKKDIIREVWRVVYSDGSLHGHEDHIMHQLGRLLNLTHPQLIEAKLAVTKELGG